MPAVAWLASTEVHPVAGPALALAAALLLLSEMTACTNARRPTLCGLGCNGAVLTY